MTITFLSYLITKKVYSKVTCSAESKLATQKAQASYRDCCQKV